MSRELPVSSISLPGGYTVAFVHADCYNPPGNVGGLNLNSTALWVRLVRSGWDSGWHVCVERSRLKGQLFFDLVVSEADIPEAWMETTGERWWPPCRTDEAYRQGSAWLDGLAR